MILRNYDSIMQQITGGGIKPKGPYDTKWLAGCPGIVRDYHGSYYFCNDIPVSYGFFGCESAYDNYTAPGAHPALLVGSGNNDVTYDDYTMAYAKGLSVVGYRGYVVTYSAEACAYVMTKTFINNTAEDITVNEIGMFTGVTGNNPNNTTNYSIALLTYREKLAEPVTLSANGGKATFSVTVNVPLMNKPSA